MKDGIKDKDVAAIDKENALSAKEPYRQRGIRSFGKPKTVNTGKNARFAATKPLKRSFRPLK